MKVRFLGGARTVTGSMHLVETRQGDVLLECGLFQGRRKEAAERNRNLPKEARKARAVVLSHAHIDHSGALPSLVRSGWQGRIHCTAATADLLEVMLLDSANIHEKDADHLNRHRPGRAPKIEPLYTTRDAEKTLRLLEPHDYGETFEPVEGTHVTLHDAGHILGSAVVHLEVREPEGTTRMMFTGDLGRKGLPILRDPQLTGPVDAILSESTYGNRDHEPPGDTAEKLLAVVERTLRRGGRVVIPAFAVGRTQAIVYLLHRLRHEGRLPDTRIYIDSPMAVRATRVFARHPDLFDAEAREFLLGRGKVFSSMSTAYLSSVEDSKRLNEVEDPVVVISASGMCEAGRVLHHLRYTLHDPKNTVLFVGYQAEHTLGRRILEGAEKVNIFRERHAVRCEVARINGLSAHADRGQIAEYLDALPGTKRRLFLVHGDLDRCEALRGYLEERGLPRAAIPAPGEVADLSDLASG